MTKDSYGRVSWDDLSLPPKINAVPLRENKPLKVYQIEKTEGTWEDTWRTIVGTYLSKKKAESELAKLKAAVPDCDECPYSDEGKETPINTTCPHHKPKYYAFPGYAPYYTCENNLDSYDTPSYSLLEFDVDESEVEQ